MKDHFSEPRCQCCEEKTAKRTVAYILGPKTNLVLGRGGVKFENRKIKLAAKFTEPFPDGVPATLLVCPVCDHLKSWPRTMKTAATK